MMRTTALCCCLTLLSALPLAAVEQAPLDSKREAQQAKELSGMSIVGNDEAPTALYIVPWKSSEIEADHGLEMMLNKDAVPVDRDVFKRQLDFYEVSTANQPWRTK
jgi:hypothetical protein